MDQPTRTEARLAEAATNWWMVAVLFTLYVFSWVDRLILSMLVKPIKADLLLSDFRMSLLLGTAFAVSYAVFGLPLGWAVDRFQRRLVVFFGVLLWAFCTVASGFAHSFEALLFARIGVGVGEAALIPASYSLIADAFAPQKLTVATSTFQMGGKAGSAAAFGLGGIVIAWATTLHGINFPLLGVAQPWQIVMVLVGLPGFALAFLLFTFKEPVRRNLGSRANTAVSPGQLKGFVSANLRLVLLMMVSFSCLSICGYTLTSWVPTYLERSFGWEPLRYGPALSAMNIIAALSLVVNGKIVDTLFRRGMKDVHLRFYSWLVLAVSPAALALFLVRDPWVFLGLYCVIQFVTVPFMVYVSTIIALLAPNAIRGQLIAMFMFVFNILGLGAGPAMVGALTDYVFHSEARIGDSMMIVIIGCFVVGFITMRMGLRDLGPAIRRAEAS